VNLGARPRILIVRLSAIGDCVHTLPVLCALRQAYPRAYLAWATQGGGAKLITGHECLDQLIKVERGWLKSPRAAWRLRRELRRERFDVALDVQGLTKSAAVAWLSGAPCRIGLDRRHSREASTWFHTVRVAPRRRHVVERYLEILRPLGIESPEIRFDMPLDGAACANLFGQLAQLGICRPFAVINPGAGWDSKLWPATRYARVAAALGRKFDLPSVVVWAGDRELAWAREIAAGSEGHACVAPSTSLKELVELCRAANLFVGSDTGPLHIAAAVGAPCVAIYGPTRPAICGPYGASHESLQAFYQAGSSRQRRGSDNSAMRAISVEQVVEACGRVLESGKREFGSRAA